MVRELLSAGLETVLEEFHIATTAVAALLVLYFVLDDEGLVREGNGLGKGSGDGVVSSLALRHETLVALDDRDRGVLNFPFADVAEGLAADGSLLGGLRGSPPFCPVVCELLNEGSLDLSGLHRGLVSHATRRKSEYDTYCESRFWLFV